MLKTNIHNTVNLFSIEGVLGMALKNTTNKLKQLLGDAVINLEKAEGGNKAAAQRVRTGTIKLEKIAKLYRKESIAEEKKGKGKPKAKSKAKPKRTVAKKAASKKSAGAKKKTAVKKTAAKKTVRTVRKKSTAKIPSRRKTAR